MRKKSLGEKLRDARVAKGLSLYDVESVSGVEAQYLLAVEMDQLKVLPKDVRKHAFTEYANTLGFDGEALYLEQIETVEQEKTTTIAVKEQLDRELEAKKILSRFSRHKREEKRKSAYLPLLILSMISLLIVLSVGYIIYRHLSNQPQVIQNTSFTTVNHVSSSPQTALSHSVSEVTVSGLNVTKAVNGKTLTLDFSNFSQPVKLVFKLTNKDKETWLSISNRETSENLVLSEDGQRKVEVTVDEKTPSNLVTLGQASRITLTINDQPVDLSELADDILSYIVLSVK